MDTLHDTAPGDHVLSLEDIQDAIECVICLDIPKNDPVYQCNHGHILCNECHARVTDCPICKVKLGRTRALVVEKVLAKYPRCCKFEDYGCNVKLPKEQLQTHENVCVHKTLNCPMLFCKTIISQIQLMQHIYEEHAHYYIKIDKPSWNGDLVKIQDAIASETGYSWHPTLVEFDGKHFFHECWKDVSGTWHCWVYMVGNNNDSQNYIFTVKIIHSDQVEELSYTGHCVPLHVEKEEISKRAMCLIFENKIANRFCNNGTTLAYTTQIRRSPSATVR